MAKNNRLTWQERRALRAWMQEVGATFTRAYAAGELALLATEALGFPVTANNVRPMRQEEAPSKPRGNAAKASAARWKSDPATLETSGGNAEAEAPATAGMALGDGLAQLRVAAAQVVALIDTLATVIPAPKEYDLREEARKAHIAQGKKAVERYVVRGIESLGGTQ